MGWKKWNGWNSSNAQVGLLEESLPPAFADVLAAVPRGSRVAVVTMRGSLNPITLGHVQGFFEARRILLAEPGAVRPSLLEDFAEVLGLVSLNGDGHVASKMSETGEPFMPFADRLKLVELATAEHAWIGPGEDRGYETWKRLKREFPDYSFVYFTLNGADDVAKYKKYEHSEEDRYITMGRHGATEKVLAGMRQAGVDPERGYFFLGPELPDISSTEARRALRTGDAEALQGLLHPAVAEWCLRHGPYQPHNQVPARCQVDPGAARHQVSRSKRTREDEWRGSSAPVRSEERWHASSKTSHSRQRYSSQTWDATQTVRVPETSDTAGWSDGRSTRERWRSTEGRSAWA